MANKVARSKKPVLKTIHTWIGIVSGIFLSVVALTGSVILFRAEFERAALPSGAALSSHRASLDDAAREIAKARPDSHIRRVRIPASPEDPYLIQIQSPGKRTEKIVSDASTAKVLGTQQAGWMDWMVDLHRNLLSGGTGRSVVGAIGIALFVLSATGLLMWLRGARNWRAWISVRRQGSVTRFNYELHRASGLWAYAFLALISFTGIELAYPNTFRNTVQSVTGKPATMRGPRDIHADLKLSLDEYVQLGRAAMPDGVPVELRLPEPGKGPVDLRLYRAGDLSPSGNHVYLDPATGAVLMIDRIVDRPIGARFLAAMSPLHYAQFGGMTVKVAWALFGLAPLLLFVTGLIAWWRPKSQSNQTAPREAGREDLAIAGR
jgi:uncharacterized iron-regulated membrane protein